MYGLRYDFLFQLRLRFETGIKLSPLTSELRIPNSPPFSRSSVVVQSLFSDLPKKYWTSTEEVLNNWTTELQKKSPFTSHLSPSSQTFFLPFQKHFVSLHRRFGWNGKTYK